MEPTSSGQLRPGCSALLAPGSSSYASTFQLRRWLDAGDGSFNRSPRRSTSSALLQTAGTASFTTRTRCHLAAIHVACARTARACSRPSLARLAVSTAARRRRRAAAAATRCRRQEPTLRDEEGGGAHEAHLGEVVGECEPLETTDDGGRRRGRRRAAATRRRADDEGPPVA
jgi:hypothetical protein